MPPKDALPPNFIEKNFANNVKTSKFVKVFFLESFLLAIQYLALSESLELTLSMKSFITGFKSNPSVN